MVNWMNVSSLLAITSIHELPIISVDRWVGMGGDGNRGELLLKLNN